MITIHGKETAVLIPIAEWQRLQQKQPSLRSLLLATSTAELDIPERGKQQEGIHNSVSGLIRYS